MDLEALLQELATALAHEGESEQRKVLLQQLVTMHPGAADEVTRASLHVQAVSATWPPRNPDLALHHLKAASDLYSAAGATNEATLGRAHCASGLGHVYARMSRHALASAFFLEARRLYLDSHEEQWASWCDEWAEKVYEERDSRSSESQDTEELLRTTNRFDADVQSSITAQKPNDLHVAANCAFSLGAEEYDKAAYAEARRLFEQARRAYEALGLARETAECDRRIALIALTLNHVDSARRLAEEASAAFQRLGYPGGRANCEILLGHTYLPDAPEAALGYFRQSAATFEDLDWPRGLATAHESMAIALAYSGRHAEARVRYLAARSLWSEEDYSGAAGTEAGLGQMALLAGNLEDAERHMRAACRLWTLQNNASYVYAGEVVLAGVLRQRGDVVGALELAVPAVIALDAYRFGLPHAEDRLGWRAEVGRFYEQVLHLAIEAADGRLFAELVESARGNGVPDVGHRREFNIVGSSQAAFTTAVDDGDGTGEIVAQPAPWSGPVAGAGLAAIALAPPPAVVLPWGRALDRALAAAERRGQPVRGSGNAVLRLCP